MKNSVRKQIIAGNEISEIREFNLGGYRQKVLIDGKSKGNPVVINLHGGPGSPVPFGEGCRGLFPEITERVTMVCWDQLGCGINDRIIDDSFSIRDYIEMTGDLIREIRTMFPENRLTLFGVSWGSVLALNAAVEYGELIDRAVTYGQVLCDLTFNDEVLGALMSSPLSPKKKEELREMMSKRDLDSMRKIMVWIRRYTEGYQAKGEKNADMAGIILGMLKSPDYSFRDFRAVVYNGTMKNRSLLKELAEIDLRGRLGEIKVPYTVIQGEKDIVTSTKNAVKEIEGCGNENVRLITVEGNGHIPNKRGMEVIIGEMTE